MRRLGFGVCLWMCSAEVYGDINCIALISWYWIYSSIGAGID
jgi:hypothetical protein